MHCPSQLASERTSNLERFACGIEVSDETESVAKRLPVPPDQEIVDLCFLLRIIEEFQDAAIKALGVGSRVGARKHRRRRQRETGLDTRL
jgi:hypothetical protein